MSINRLKEKLNEQENVYVSLKRGDTSLVCYKEFQNGTWGTDDANYTNRLRLAYYLLYSKKDDEAVISYLFQEELKDRERNSFQGIGTALQILTWLLKKYDTDNKYTALFERAKNANFDCACGYSVEEVVNDDFESNNLLDCIYICEELVYKEIMGSLVDEWKRNMTNWTPSNRCLLIEFNTFLGNEAENEELYQEQLAKTLTNSSSEISDIISSYHKLIQYYGHVGNWEKALHYCVMVIERTDHEQIKRRNLFAYILESCLEVIAHNPIQASSLWHIVKVELQSKSNGFWYGNLYKKGIAAAKAMGDPYMEELEQEHLEWIHRSCL